MSKLSILVIVLALAAAAPAQVYIQEYCSDPFNALFPPGLDTNGDGIAASSGNSADDEFVEIVNFGGSAVDISGWKFSDSGGVRHIFTSGTSLPAGAAIIIFGGGDLTNFNAAGARGVVASQNSGVSLNNGGDILSLHDSTGTLIDQQIYSGGGGPGDADGESSTRVPEVPGGAFQHHSFVTPGVLHSAGFKNNGAVQYALPVIPTAAYPGDASDAEFEVDINGVVDNNLLKVHSVVGGDLIKLDLMSPGGTLIGQPFLVAMQFFTTGNPVFPQQITGVFSIWLSATGGLAPPVVVYDGLSCSSPFCPVLVPGGVELGFVVPTNLAGLNLSVMTQMVVDDPGVNAPFDLGFSDAHEFQIQ